MDLLATYGPVVRWYSVEQSLCGKCKPTGREVLKGRKLSNGLPAKLLREPEVREVWDSLCSKCQEHCETYSHLVAGREMQHILTDNELA